MINNVHDSILNIKWKTEPCHSGESCWCRKIVPVEPIYLGDFKEEYEIASYGSIAKDLAEHIVKLHNDNLDKINKEKQITKLK